MIRAEAVSYKAGDKYLVRDIAINVQPGKLHLIIGPNGAGKSTLIKLLSGQLSPANGNVFYGDKNIKQYSLAELSQIRAVLSQNLDATFPLTVQEIVMMGRYPHFTGTPQEKDLIACNEAMVHFDIGSFADRDYNTLSGGEKQRVHFARVMAQIWYPAGNISRYLLLDEPLTYLDIYYQLQFLQQIKQFLSSQDITVVGVVHDLNLAAKFADEITLLNDGLVIATGSPGSVLTKSNIQAAYRIAPDLVDLNGISYLLF